jgi:WXG100 family type VII secretion target
MSRIGGDMAQMESLKGTFTKNANSVATLTGELQQQVDTIVGTGWEGPAANNFREAWASQFKPALDKLKAALDEAAREVDKRREAIQQAGS